MEQFIEFVGNHYILSTAWIVIVVLIIYSFASGALSAVKELNPQEATLLMNKEDAYVLDIRPPAEYKKGHILGAKQIKTELVNKADFSPLEKNKDKPIIVACAMGMNAKRTATQMHKAGFSQVSVLKGGMNAWQGANLPVTK